MAITLVEPKTSKITGGVVLDLYGSGFDQPDTVIPVNEIETTDTSGAGGLLSYNGTTARLSLNGANNSRASFNLNRIMPEAFNLELLFSSTVKSFPLTEGVKALGIDLIDASNVTNKVRVYLTYEGPKGYLLVIETWKNLSLQHREETSFDPKKIESISVQACGKYIHGFVKSNAKHINFGKTSELIAPGYSVRVFTECPTEGVSYESEIDIKHLVIHPMVSFIGYPTEIISWSNSHVRVKTTTGEISIGDILLSTGNATVHGLRNHVRYVKGSAISVVRKQFDTVQAIINEYVNPAREKLFKSSNGFKWDEGYLLSESNKNNNLAVPNLWDPTTGNIPASFFQSGTAPSEALEFKGIEKFTAEDQEKWFAQIKHGTYYVRNVPYYLFSDESVIEYLGEGKTEDGRSKHPLLFKPKIGVPIVASSLGEKLEDNTIIEKRRFQKRGRFTGKVLNGVELNTSNPANIDQTKEEFIVIYNSNNEVKNWLIPVTNIAAGRFEFTLPETPMREFKLRFSRKDIFKNEKIVARKYGEDVYNLFQYGEGIEEIGDYAIDYSRRKVEVLIDRPYTDLGYLSYTFDYPAVIEFNNDYTSDNGTYLSHPTFSDLKSLDNIGTSNGQSNQKFRLSDFPVIDNSTYATVDTSNFKLFTYDEFDNTFDGEWKRVASINNYGPEEKVYTVNSAEGIVAFGDGINGKKPGKYLQILVGYKPTLKIQYEPESSSDIWSGKNIDLNLTKQTINSGFLYLSRKNLLPAQILLEFATPNINAFETADINGTVLTQDGDVVSGARVHFEILAGGGMLRDSQLLSNPNGEISTIYTPSSRLEDIGIRIDIYQPSEDPLIKGNLNPFAYGDKNGVPYMSLKADEVIQGKLEDIYLFKILDDGDPFLSYNNETRKGGRLVLLYNNNGPIRGEYLAGNVIGFASQLPQSVNPDGPNYDPELRGFYIIGKKTVQARAFINLEDIRIYSDIIRMTVEYSPLQKGTWRLPTPPIDFESTQINTATYINID